MDQGLWRDYLKLLDGLGQSMDQLAEIERKKTEAVSRSDLNAVEDYMAREQALSLSLRGFEQRRGAMLAKLGIPSTSLRQLEQYSPQGLELETRQAVEKVRRKYEEFQSAASVARNTLECNLRAIEKLRASQEERPTEAAPPAEPRQYDFRG